MIATMAQLFDPIATSSDGTKSNDVYDPMWKKKKEAKDQLTLSGLLNVLNGVVDTPGRIVIMTTSHPEQLASALIRPGWIDKKILFGYMSPEDAIEMMEHYFQTSLSHYQMDRVKSVLRGSVKLTPAQIEQLSAEYDEVDERLEALEATGVPSPPETESTRSSIVTLESVKPSEVSAFHANEENRSC